MQNVGLSYSSGKYYKNCTEKSSNLLYVIIIIDAKGRTVINSRISGEELELYISTYPSGVYFVRIIDGDRILDKKFVK